LNVPGSHCTTLSLSSRIKGVSDIVFRQLKIIVADPFNCCTALQHIILTATLVVTDLIVMACYTGLASKVLRLLKKLSQMKMTNRILGSLFIAAGGALAVFRRGS